MNDCDRSVKDEANNRNVANCSLRVSHKSDIEKKIKRLLLQSVQLLNDCQMSE